MGKTTEELKAELAALEEKTTGAPKAEPTDAPTAQLLATAPTTRKFTDAESASLAEMKKMLTETIKDDPRPYLAAHKKCAVCLRHQSKQAAQCELCSTEGHWEAVVDHHPTWKRLGRAHASTREHLSNLRSHTASLFDATHLRWLLTWREGDGTRQINAAKFVPTPFVLSYEQRCWCKQLLKWIEPGAITQEPEPDEPEPEVEAVATTTQGRKEIPPGDLNKLFEYQQWKVEREAANLPSSVADWSASK
jgi:ketosteroid isomerase-like protein